MLPVARLPATDMSEPASRPLFLVSKLSSVTTPGMSWVSCRKLRPLSGSSRTCSPVIRPATSPPMVSTTTAEDVTVTASVTAPTSSCASTSMADRTCRITFWVTKLLKPSFSIVTT